MLGDEEAWRPAGGPALAMSVIARDQMPSGLLISLSPESAVLYAVQGGQVAASSRSIDVQWYIN